MSRLNYLDNLKVALTFLVIFHHAGQAYGDGGEWGYTPSNPEEVMPWILFQNKKSMVLRQVVTWNIGLVILHRPF